MSTDDLPVCVRHTDQVRMSLRTLHSDQLAPEQVLGVYACPECGSVRRLPLAIAGRGSSGAGERSSSMGAA